MRRTLVLLSSLLLACATPRARSDAGTHDAGATHDAAATIDAFVARDVGQGVDAFVAPPVDAGIDAFVAAVDAGHDAAVLVDAGHDAAVVTTGCGTHLVISELLTRGATGGNEEFVELYNPTGAAVVLDATWTLEARSTSAASYAVRWTGTSTSIPAHGHFLVTGAMYAGGAASDGMLSSGVADAGSLLLKHGSAVVDALCFAYDASSQAALDASYTCEGMPASNAPHDNAAAGNVDSSLERRAGGAAGSCVDTGDNASDFATLAPSAPQSSGSPATP